MITNNQNLFANAISIEKMENRLELAAAASKTSVTASVTGSSSSGVSGTVGVSIQL
jgi:hypothetical protein